MCIDCSSDTRNVGGGCRYSFTTILQPLGPTAVLLRSAPSLVWMKIPFFFLSFCLSFYLSFVLSFFFRTHTLAVTKCVLHKITVWYSGRGQGTDVRCLARGERSRYSLHQPSLLSLFFLLTKQTTKFDNTINEATVFD